MTDNQRIAYSEWLEDPAVFMLRAERWNGRKNSLNSE